MWCGEYQGRYLGDIRSAIISESELSSITQFN